MAEEIEALVGTPAESIIRVSAKDGINVESVLREIVEKIPPPKGDPNAPLQALIFDSHYDSYKGVVAYVRVMEGTVQANNIVRMMATNTDIKPVEIGIFSPGMVPINELSSRGCGLYCHRVENVKECRVGDTLTLAANPAEQPCRISPSQTDGICRYLPGGW